MFSVRYLSSRPMFSVPGLEIRGVGINETMPPCLVRRPSGTGDCLFMLFHDPAWIGPQPVEGRAAQAAGTLMLWPRGAAHFYGNPEMRWRHSWVHCSGKQVEAALAARDVPVNIPIRPHNPARIARTLLDLYEELHSDRPDSLIARNLLVNLLREAGKRRGQAEFHQLSLEFTLVRG